MGRVIAVVIVVWLVIGIIAAGQRGYYTRNGAARCANAGDAIVTIVAGPLNYVGVNPEINCPEVPQPSK